MDKVLKFKRRITKLNLIIISIIAVTVIFIITMLFLFKNIAAYTLITPLIIVILEFPYRRYYVINPEKSLLRCGDLIHKININKIESLCICKKEYVGISYTKNSRKIKDVVTPEDIDGFIKALQEINGNITIENL